MPLQTEKKKKTNNFYHKATDGWELRHLSKSLCLVVISTLLCNDTFITERSALALLPILPCLFNQTPTRGNLFGPAIGLRSLASL